MSEKHWGRLGRLADGLSVGQAVWGWSAFWTAVTALAGWAAYTVEWVGTHGWGAAFFVGVGTACALMLFVSLGMFAWGYLKSRSPSHPALAAAPAGAAAGGSTGLFPDSRAMHAVMEGRLSDGRDLAAVVRRDAKLWLVEAERDMSARLEALRKEQEQALGEFRKETAEGIAALRKDVDRALGAVRHNAEAMREIDTAEREMREENAARFEMIRKTAEHALEQGRLRLEAFDGRLKEVAAKAEALTWDVFRAMSDGNRSEFDKLGERLASVEAGLGSLRENVERRFLARNAARRLRDLFNRLGPAARRLVDAEPLDFPDGDAWLRAYKAWHADMKEFWQTASAWDGREMNPLALSDEDLGRVRGAPPEDDRFASFELQSRWRALCAANFQHGQYAGEALARIETQARGHP